MIVDVSRGRSLRWVTAHLAKVVRLPHAHIVDSCTETLLGSKAVTFCIPSPYPYVRASLCGEISAYIHVA